MLSTTYPITGGDFEGAGAATRCLKAELARLGVEAAIMRRIMIAAYEAEMNVVIHARKGSMWARLDGGRLDLEIVDEGPGIPDIPTALREGFSTAPETARQMGFGAGMGLPNIRKSSDLFEIESRVGSGTRVRSTIYLRGMAAEEAGPGGLELGSGLCRGCLACVRACPSGALRVRGTEPLLLDHLCIGCTACIAACPVDVFRLRGLGDEPGMLPAAKGTVLVLPRGFATGFPGGVGPRRVAEELLSMGFGRVRFTEEWEAPLAAEACRRAAADPACRPLITPSCPAVVNLVEAHFPSLIPHLLPLASPVEAAVEEHPLSPVALVPACPAQHAAASRERLTDRLTLVPLRRLQEALMPRVCSAGERELGGGGAHAGAGNGPAVGAGRRGADVLRVTGIRHALAVLEQVEAGALGDVSVLECFACDQGCIGSPLFAGDPFVAARRWDAAGLISGEGAAALPRKKGFAPRPGLRLDPDMTQAMAKLAAIDSLARTLPGRDCTACGAPGCPAFAEDVVLGRAAVGDCPHLPAAAQREPQRRWRDPQ